jgi:hypothetical protein
MSEAGRALYEAALAHERAGDVPAAFEAFRSAAKADPRVAAPYVGLARLLSRNHQRGEAIACLDRAAAIEPGNAAIVAQLAGALVQEGRLEQAVTIYVDALNRLGPAPRLLLGLATLQEDRGERDAAADAYRRVLAADPVNADALAGLLGVAEGDALAGVIDTARTTMTDAADRDAALIGYALGKALDRVGDHPAAFDAWSKANAARRRMAGAFDRAAFDGRVDRLIALFDKDFFEQRRGWGDPSERPVFIVGLPRSGTTLTEQVLSAHPEVHGAGELDLLTDMATGTPDRLGSAEPAWPETAPLLSQTHIVGIAHDHLARLAALAPADAMRVIDKQPLNFWHLGLVALALPGARVIHCTRDIRDNGLSIFVENFAADQRWATDLEDIAHYWRGYRRLMAHWRGVLGDRMIEVPYEDAIDDIESQARRWLGFLDLPWDDAVLAFHRSDRAVQTPSRWQVRQPIYRSSAGRWRRYAAELAPLIAATETVSA